jgi:hypothetical protein
MNIPIFVFFVGAKVYSLAVGSNYMKGGSDLCPASDILIVIS